MSPNTEAMLPVGGSCLSGRPPRAPRPSASSASSLLSIVARYGIRRPVAPRRSVQLSFWDDEVGGPGAREPLNTLSRRASGISTRPPDGSDAIATALMRRRRRTHGGTPSRPDDNGAHFAESRRSPSASSMASLKALQAVARADFARAVGVKAEAAAAAATLSGSASPSVVLAALAADERAVSVFRTAQADATKAVAEAKSVCAAAAAAAAAAEAASAAASTAVGASSESASSTLYFSPVSDFE